MKTDLKRKYGYNYLIIKPCVCSRILCDYIFHLTYRKYNLYEKKCFYEIITHFRCVFL